MSEEKTPLESALYWLLKDAITYARLKAFDGYLNEHGGLELVHPSEKEDHEMVLKDRLARSAVSYFHATTLGESVPITVVVQRGDDKKEIRAKTINADGSLNEDND